MPELTEERVRDIVREELQKALVEAESPLLRTLEEVTKGRPLREGG